MALEMQQSRRALAAVALLLAMMGVLAGGAARREAVTVDEVAHIGAGVSALQKLDLRMNPEHPPLPKVLSALPLVLRGTRADYLAPVALDARGIELNGAGAAWTWALGAINGMGHAAQSGVRRSGLLRKDDACTAPANHTADKDAWWHRHS